MPSWKPGKKKGKPRLKKTAIGEALAHDFAAEIERLVGREAAAALDFEALEMVVRRQALRFSARVVEPRLNADHSDFTGARRPCLRHRHFKVGFGRGGKPRQTRGRKFDRDALGKLRNVDRRAKPFQTVLGELRLERA